mmetsp:Transcript_15248/g.44247  ORF Transcript_15248/g.44247 Transcript_15248/m.44247 type:complete len:236 (+) Transcript_15248:638-1345(+)
MNASPIVLIFSSPLHWHNSSHAEKTSLKNIPTRKLGCISADALVNPTRSAKRMVTPSKLSTMWHSPSLSRLAMERGRMFWSRSSDRPNSCSRWDEKKAAPRNTIDMDPQMFMRKYPICTGVSAMLPAVVAAEAASTSSTMTPSAGGATNSYKTVRTLSARYSANQRVAVSLFRNSAAPIGHRKLQSMTPPAFTIPPMHTWSDMGRSSMSRSWTVTMSLYRPCPVHTKRHPVMRTV